MTAREAVRDRRQKTVERLRELGNTTFAVAHIARSAGNVPIQDAYLIAHRLVEDGLLVRVAQGLYALAERPATLAQRLFWLANSERFHLSHGSAMALHARASLPPGELLVTVEGERRPVQLTRAIAVRFLDRPRKVMGELATMQVEGLGAVPVATPETALLEGLREPNLCGGLLEVCRFAASRHGRWDGKKLVALARKQGVDAVGRRAALLMDWSGDPSAHELAALAPAPDAAVASLDPHGARRGPMDRRWRLRVNLPREEVQAALGLRTADSSAW